MSGISDQTSGSVSIDAGFRTTGPELESEPEPEPSYRPNESLGIYGSREWILPGFGERGDRCGEYYPDGVCEAGHVDWGTHSCDRRGCPRCWGRWAQKAAVRSTVRIQAFRHTQPDDHNRQVAHGVVTVPEGEIRTEREYWKARSKAAEIAEEKGMRGFAVIPHPFRPTEAAKEAFRRADPDTGIWVWLRNEYEDSIRDMIRWSPHYHVIGLTSPDMEPGDDEGWNWKFIRSLESYHGVRDLESHEDLYGAFRYLYSHTGWPEDAGKQSTTWYGCLANSVFVEDASEGWQHEKPREGTLRRLEEAVEDVAGGVLEPDEDGGGGREEEDESRVCDHDDCSEDVIDVWDIRDYLRQVDPPTEVRHRMEVAYDWRMGRVEPPPGIKRPSTRDEAIEAFEAML